MIDGPAPFGGDSFEHLRGNPEWADTAQLADLAAVSLTEWIDVAGGPWWRLHVDVPTTSADGRIEWEEGARDWFGAGQPLQVLVRPPASNEPDDRLAVHLPGIGAPDHLPRIGVGSRVAAGPIGSYLEGWLPLALKDASARRRRTFRWCNYCRTLYDKQGGNDGACISCQEGILGIVH